MFDNLPNVSAQSIAIKVKPSIEKIIRKEHPWLFDGGIKKQSKEGNAGDLAIIYDNRKNKFLAMVFMIRFLLFELSYFNLKNLLGSITNGFSKK